MTLFLWNLLLALAWVMLSGNFSPLNLLAGFVLAYVILWLLIRGADAPSGYFGRVWLVLRFAGFYVWKLVQANLLVAYDVMTPDYLMKPGIVAIPLDAETDAEITLLANLITLTPGTLSLDVSYDRKVLYIHAMYINDLEKLRSEIKNDLERRVLEVLR